MSDTRHTVRTLFAVYYRDFDPLTASHDECLHVRAFTIDEALADCARVLSCNVGDLRAYVVAS